MRAPEGGAPEERLLELLSALEEVAVLRIRPGDVIVLRVDDRMSAEEAGAAHGRLEAMFPGHQVLVTQGCRLELARPAEEPASWAPRHRLRMCVEAWPECQEGAYHPACCRFPKSCSCTVYDDELVAEADLEDGAGA